ncbi:MAG: PorT family protein [Sphingobacteriales bacterium]|nr:MAG: PorT family protein [Sphingobacteriales bacterium]
MKKVLLTIAAFSGLTVAANAQYARFGVKAGGMLTTASRTNVGTTNFENKLAPGLYAGGLVEFSFKSKADKFKLQLEADYSYMTIRHDYLDRGNTVDDRSRAHMVSVPVLAKYFFTPDFSLYAGPSANLNLSSNAKTEVLNGSEFNRSTNDDVNKFQLGAMVGLNYYIYKGFFVEARYHALLPEYYKANNLVPDYGTIHNFQLGVGYKF